jgi:hypothetical protein
MSETAVYNVGETGEWKCACLLLTAIKRLAPTASEDDRMSTIKEIVKHYSPQPTPNHCTILKDMLALIVANETKIIDNLGAGIYVSAQAPVEEQEHFYHFTKTYDDMDSKALGAEMQTIHLDIERLNVRLRIAEYYMRLKADPGSVAKTITQDLDKWETELRRDMLRIPY